MKDLDTFQAYFETLDVEQLEKRSATPTPTIALHTLPELHVEGYGGAGDTPELRILDVVGQGGMGQVHLANQLPLDREVAVKTLRAHVDDKAARALLQEACVTGFLEHPNIIPIYTVGRTADGAPLIVMKRVEGFSLLDRLKGAGEGRGAEDLEEPIETLIQVCNAVRFAHSRGILHRDIKPENIMLGHFNEVYLLDWGIAVSMREDRPLLPHRAQAKAVAGTPYYMAPEMTLEDPAQLDERTDVFLLGATLHHILTGRPRYTGDTLVEIMFEAHRCEPYDYGEDVPVELANIAARTCHRDKEERFASAEEFQRALQDYVRHRESIELSTSAERKRVELEALLSAEEPDVIALHDTYGESRFGFYQAQRMWPANPQAEAGLQACLETMADFYLAQKNLDAARACIAEMAERRPELEERAAVLAAQRDEDQQDFDRLKKLERDRDLRTSTSTRSLLAYIFAVVWTSMRAWEAMFPPQESMTYAEQLEAYMRIGVLNFSVAVVGVLLFRKRIFVNAANRRLIYSLLAISGSVALLGFGVWYMEGVLHHARIYAYVIYSLGIVSVGLMSDLRICLVAIPFGLTAVVGILWPPYLAWTAVVANFFTFAGLGWIWSPRQMKKQVSF